LKTSKASEATWTETNDNTNWLILTLIIQFVHKLQYTVFDHINWLITLTVITLSKGRGISKTSQTSKPSKPSETSKTSRISRSHETSKYPKHIKLIF
jgi:hypothetical protein